MNSVEVSSVMLVKQLSHMTRSEIADIYSFIGSGGNLRSKADMFDALYEYAVVEQTPWNKQRQQDVLHAITATMCPSIPFDTHIKVVLHKTLA